MNKLRIRYTVVAVIIFLASSVAQAANPHDYYSCSSCHNTHKTLGTTGYDNTCLRCHSPGNVDRAGTVITPFSPRDMANPYGTAISPPGANFQTSHKWNGSDDVPMAGAQPPTPSGLDNGDDGAGGGTANKFIGMLSCARCHNLHTLTGPPLMRVSNDVDQICLNCHRSRDNQTHVLGSHPVSVNYANIAASKPNEFYSTPINSNPANPTSAMKLNNSNMLCTTCHGVHFTDSNSRTLDNYSSAIFNRLSTSNGLLLRTDLYGQNATATNICTNCHKTTDVEPLAKVKNHNGSKLQNIQCADCHAGHVDYDKNDPTSLPNKFLIKRYMALSSAQGRFNTTGDGKVLMQYTSLASQNWAKDSYGVCVACHSTLPPSVSEHSSINDTVKCASCHTHQQGFSANCTGCHGFPPQANHAGKPDGFAAGYINAAVVDESLSPHQSHATGQLTNSYYSFGCEQCHKGNNHNSTPATYQDVFKDKTGIIVGSSASYNNTLRQCSNMYCHSNGLPRDQINPPLVNAPVYKTITWGNNKDSIIGAVGSTRCSSCHDAVPATNAHSKHITAGFGCVNCHSTTVSDNTTLLPAARQSGGTHVNGTKDVNFSGTLGAATLSGSNCSTVYCHTDGKGTPAAVSPNWLDKTTAACGSCHVTTAIATGAHAAHLSTSVAYGPGLNTQALPTSCNNCHVYPTGHVNGTVEKPGVATCALSCHKNGLGTATWTTGRNGITCESCHTASVSVIYGISAPDKSLASTAGHGKAGIAKACTVCHDNTTQHISSNPTIHNSRLFANLSGILNTQCNYCHNNATIVTTAAFRNMSTHFVDKVNGQKMECSKCHDLHGTSNYRMIRSQIAYINSTSWTVNYQNDGTSSTGMVNLVTGRGLCQVCHTKTNHYRAGVIGNDGHPTENCYGCHPHNAKGGAFYPSGSCDACHGYPPVPMSAVKGPYDPTKYKGTFGTHNNYSSARFEDYSGGGGAHLSHVATTVTAIDGWGPCAVCHTGGSATSSWHVTKNPIRSNVNNVTVILDPRVNFNNSLLPIYTGARLSNPPVRNVTGTCVNVACHFQPTPKWSVER